MQGDKIKVRISQHLQNQITWLCGQIHNIEWSAVLFYTTEGGTYGDETFTITAEGLFLMDIGDGTYTSYMMNQPEYIKFLMDNPDMRKMQKGHIHSHHNMSVFFSGTDTQEIIDNSEFHNYYLSLIVNNRNQMLAQVAYRVTTETETKKSTWFKDLLGSIISKKDVMAEKQTTVCVYETRISKPFRPETTFIPRYEQIKKKLDIVNESRSEKFSKSETGKTIGSFSDFVKESNQATQNNRQPDPKIRELFDNIPSAVASPESAQLRSFLIDFLGRSVRNQTLKQIIGNLNKRMTSNEQMTEFFASIAPNTFTTYTRYFAEDPEAKNFDKRIGQAMMYMSENYMAGYPFITQKTITFLKSLKIAK